MGSLRNDKPIDYGNNVQGDVGQHPYHNNNDGGGDDDEYYTRTRLGYRPEAPPPDFANVRSRVDNRNKNYKKKPKPGLPHRREYQQEQFWPSTPEKEKKIADLTNEQHNNETKEISYHKNRPNYRQLQETNDDDDLYIRESTSAPLDTRDESPPPPQEVIKPSRPKTTDSQKAYDVFRPPGYKRPPRTPESPVNAMHNVREGMQIGDQPVSIKSQEDQYKDDVAMQMWIEAERDLKKDNRQLKQELAMKNMAEKKPPDDGLDMKDVCCLCPCFCCCFCKCDKVPKAKKSKIKSKKRY